MPPRYFDGLRNEVRGPITISPLQAVPSTLTKPGDRLCDTCEALKLTPSQFVVSSDEDKAVPKRPDIRLGPVRDVKKKAYCPLCRIALSLLGGDAFPDAQSGQPVEIWLEWFTDGISPGAYPVQINTPLIRVLRPYAQTQGSNWSPVGSLGASAPRITMLANDAPRPSSTLSLMRVIGDQIDFRVLTNALELCNKWHGSACDKSDTFHAPLEDPVTSIPHFRVIDTEENCIVCPSRGCTYATLSYVWGKIDPKSILRLVKANVAQLTGPGSLLLPQNLDRIPMTIRDAMAVIRRLGLRFLWVDSLCIVQDDDGPGGSKMSAISKMDLVYGGALLTVVAATGADANAGLPGVRPGTRGSAGAQTIEELYPGLRVGYMGSIKPASDQQVYYERAWTFQEDKLSSRRLLFQHSRVVFQCQKNLGKWREDVVFEDAMEPCSSNETHNVENGSSSNEPSNIKDFADLISAYSCLSLTYDSDIYNAFAGMNRHFKDKMQATLCHRIPDAYFDWFLLWMPFNKVLVRRDIAPSWSWSGWIGGTDIDILGHTYNLALPPNKQEIQQRTWIIWYQRKAHDSEECLPVLDAQTEVQISPEIFHDGPLHHRFAFNCSRTLPTARKLTNAPTYVEDGHHPRPGSGFLQFWTVSVIFKLDRTASIHDVLRPESEHTCVGIFGCDGRELGTINLNPEWAERNIARRQEFILLCEGRCRPFYRGGDIDWKYIIMLLEWHGNWAERVSLGAIRKDDLCQALEGPVWKEIVLG